MDKVYLINIDSEVPPEMEVQAKFTFGISTNYSITNVELQTAIVVGNSYTAVKNLVVEMIDRCIKVQQEFNVPALLYSR